MNVAKQRPLGRISDRSQTRRPRLRLESLDDRISPAVALDQSFGVGGIVTTSIGRSHDNAQSVVVQPDGKIVVAGTTSNGADLDFAVLRYNADGSLDSTFSGDGKVETDFGGQDRVFAACLQADGKILVAGLANASGEQGDFAIARYNTDGSLDQSFDGDGKLTTSFGGEALITGIAVQPDGDIVAGGEVRYALGPVEFALARYHANGSLDQSFGNDGMVTTDFGHGNNFANALALQADGKIVLVGDASDGMIDQFAIARYLPDGSLDPAFGNAGLVTTYVGNELSGADAVGLQSDGKIVVAGSAQGPGGRDIGMVRYNVDGTLDSSFGDGGQVLTDVLNSSYDRINSLTVGADDAIFFEGYSYVGNSNDFTALKFDSNGFLDHSFGFNTIEGVKTGKIWIDFGGTSDFAAGGTVQPDGKPIVVGEVDSGTGDYARAVIGMVRFGSDGIPDATFGNFGKVTTVFRGGDDVITAVAVRADGKIVAAGHSINNNSDYSLARYLPNGQLDSRFWSNGASATRIGFSNEAISSLAIGADGLLFTAGFVSPGYTPDGNDDFAISSFVDNGGLNLAFDQDGTVTIDFGGQDRATGVYLQSDYRVLAAGYTNAGGKFQFALTRYYQSGYPDPTFGVDSKVTTSFGDSDDYAMAVAELPDGRIIVVGQAFNGNDNDFAIARYLPDGSLDTTFGGGDGLVTTDFGNADDVANAIAIQPDGRIVLAGYSRAGTGNSAFALARYLSDGSLDPTFGGGGLVLESMPGGGSGVIRAIALQSDGKIVAAGSAGLGDASDFVLARFEVNGALDATFADDGIRAVAVSQGNDAASAVAIQPNGSIIAAGTAFNGTDLDYALVRFRGDNRAPVSQPLTKTLDEDTSVSVSGPLYVTDPDGDVVNVQLLSGPTHGTLTLQSNGDFTYVPDHDFNGTDNFAYKATDEFGGIGAGAVQFTVRPVDDPPVNVIEIKPDATLPGKNSLYVYGTDDADTIDIQPLGKSKATYLVSINGGFAQLVPGVTGRIYVRGLNGDDLVRASAVRIASLLDGGAGNDTLLAGSGNDSLTGGFGDDVLDGGGGTDRIVEAGDVDFTLVQGTARIDGSLTGLGTDVLKRNHIEQAELTGGDSGNRIDASAFTGRTWLRGGAGNDTLRGGKSANVLVGGEGDDQLNGGAARDLIIGGLGADTLHGGAGGDLLVGGYTIYDTNPVALDAIMLEWLSAASYATRVDHIRDLRRGGKNGGYHLSFMTVDDTLANDNLLGERNFDWFILGASASSDQTKPEQELTI